MIVVNITYFNNPSELKNTQSLQQEWNALYQQTDATPFLHWDWIHNWLKQVDVPILLVTAKVNDETVGLGIFAQKVVKSILGLQVQQWWLHRCGDSLLDQNWIEYNDFLVSKSDAVAIRDSMFKALVKWLPSSAELCIGVSDIGILEQLNCPQIDYRDTWKAPGYVLPLKELHEPQSSLLNQKLIKSFSSNTRQQIKRSFKLLSALGELSLKPLDKNQRTLVFENTFSVSHKDKWGKSSGFNNHFFVDFHHQLLCSDSAEILQISIDDAPAMYVYSLVNTDSVFFYMASMNTFADNRIKLGLVGHCLAISYYVHLGFKSYDFLAGEARYKESLASERYDMAIRHYFKSNWQRKLESKLRGIKHWFSRS